MTYVHRDARTTAPRCCRPVFGGPFDLSPYVGRTPPAGESEIFNQNTRALFIAVIRRPHDDNDHGGATCVSYFCAGYSRVEAQGGDDKLLLNAVRCNARDFFYYYL